MLWPGGFMLFVVLCHGTHKGSTSSGSGFKASQKTGKQLKFSPTDWEKPGSELATPGLQDIGLSPTSRRLTTAFIKKTFCGFSMGSNQYWAERVYDLCVYYMMGTPEGSTESGFMEKPGIEPATPGLQGIALIPYSTGAS